MKGILSDKSDYPSAAFDALNKRKSNMRAKLAQKADDLPSMPKNLNPSLPAEEKKKDMSPPKAGLRPKKFV